MTAPDSLPLHALAEDNLAAASPDLLRAMVKTFADALMSAEADALCNAEYGQVSDERVNHRNRELTARLLAAVGATWARVRHVPDRKGHDRRYAIDCTRLRTELGYRPRHDFESGLAETFAWYRDNRDWWEPLKRRQPA